MIRKILAVFIYLFTFSAFSCPNALPTDNRDFCLSFRSVASCYCTSSGLPSGMCQDINVLYARMISVFGSLDKACEYQQYTSKQDCLDNWNCYRFGGLDSRLRPCSSNANACQ